MSAAKATMMSEPGMSMMFILVILLTFIAQEVEKCQNGFLIDMAAGVYYLAFQLHPDATNLWHSWIADPNLRHHVRDVGEGLLGGLLGVSMAWNHFKVKPGKKLSWLDKWEMRLRIPNLYDNRRLSFLQLLMTTPLVLLYGTIGFFAMREFLEAISHNVLGFGHGMHWIAKLLTTHLHGVPGAIWHFVQMHWNDSFNKKLIGYAAAFFFGRRPAYAVVDDLQLFFVEQRLVGNKPLRRYHPPNFQARYNALKGQEVTASQFGDWFKWLLYGGMFIGVVLFLTGQYVLLFIAR